MKIYFQALPWCTTSVHKIYYFFERMLCFSTNWFNTKVKQHNEVNYERKFNFECLMIKFLIQCTLQFTKNNLKLFDMFWKNIFFKTKIMNNEQINMIFMNSFSSVHSSVHKFQILKTSVLIKKMTLSKSYGSDFHHNIKIHLLMLFFHEIFFTQWT